MTIQIRTELSKDACKQKLLNHMDTGLGAVWYSIGPIVGTIKGDRGVNLGLSRPVWHVNICWGHICFWPK
jgi:predicted membrane channel-forming protein YqfA (hemolysin III family)